MGLYDGIGAHLPHGIIRHKSEYVRGTTHTQGIESFWSILKRGLTGTYYHVDEGYLNNTFRSLPFVTTTGRQPTKSGLLLCLVRLTVGWSGIWGGTHRSLPGFLRVRASIYSLL